ncbi:MAG TPA: ACT domain-containing protein [Actinomycetota bacterium]|nr:ACT domain-containing protein [Actinomycetota bacterium]
MAKDLAIAVENRPGQVAAIGEALGKAGINIEGGYGSGSEGVIHVLVEDASGARKALEGAGLRITDETDALVIQGEDRPGFLGETARKIADAGINIDNIYVAAGTRIAIVTKDIEGVRKVVS